ncbi:hypothetical protein RN001_008079 [Aquatica leii]|uniref:Neprilysin n=1 Tax=Aquatica leii TaxID=1421715 RepID=A0AAN7QIS9_9COLE|nr:hypothetical protein RN001_008079 [Aquatica leii]
MAQDSNDTARRNRNNSWWKRRTNLERKGVILFIIALIVIIALIIALAIIAIQKSKSEEICYTPGCIKSAAKIIKNINSKIDPCTDFYEFACGGFVRDTIIADDEMEVSSFTEAGDILHQQLRDLYETPKTEDEIRPFKLVKDFYKSCMNTSAIEQEGLAPIKDFIKKLGGFPIVENVNWNENSFDWKQSVYRFRRSGLNPNTFIKFDTLPDQRNSSKIILYIDQPDLDINRDNLLEGFDDMIVDSYYQYLVDLAVIFGADRSFAKYEIKNLIDFLIELANVSQSDEERRDRPSLYNPMTVSELQTKYPTIYWLEFINNVLVLPESQITSNTTVSMHSPKYIAAIGDILRRTSKRTQANYVIFEAIRSLEMFLPEIVRNRESQYDSVVTGTEQRSPRWQECVTTTTSKFDLATSSLYVRKHFDPESKKSAETMVTDIRTELLKILENTDWMDEKTKKIAIDKAKKVKCHIGYADELLDDNKLLQHYESLTLGPGSCLDQLRNISIFDKNLEISLLSKKFDTSDWRTRLPATDINAVYSGYENSIQIPASILQNVFYSKDRPQAMNYGGIGYFIGHELTHGFDDQGKQLNSDGNLENWWAEETNTAFLRKAKCIIDQYSNYTLPEIGVNINGGLTQGENIADNGGIKEAYFAYKAWLKRNGDEQKLPGLDYTSKQLFWISVANCWCSKERKETLEQALVGDEHSPSRFRVIGPLSNFEDFATDFKCPLGSKMNPKQKCKVW